MTIGASTIGKVSINKKSAVKQFLEHTLGKKSLNQTQKLDSSPGRPDQSMDRMKQTTDKGFNVSEIMDSLGPGRQGGSLPVQGGRMQATMYNQ